MIEKITQAGFLFIRIVSAVLAVLFLIYSLFTLWDMFRTEIRAFASYDLLKYRPDIEHDEPPYLDELLEINPDTAAWLTIYGTNIDYPVMQGKTDLEYLNKTALGDYSVSGSIFMSVLNSKNFSDPYTLVYGHHMENGSMFGDIEKFKKKSFFYNKNHNRFKKDEGVLIMQEKVYNLKIFAIIETDAYDTNIYRADKTQDQIFPFLDYVRSKAMYYRELPNTDKILALSTCDSSYTDGRTILLCRMKIRTDPLPTREAEPLTPHRKAVGHPMAGAYWSLLNLFIMLVTVYAAFPLHLFKEKIKEFKKNKLKFFAVSASGILSVVCFILTENPHKPIQIIDRWTLPMICFLIVIIMIENIRRFDHEQENT